jgi:hypothetical protein
MSRMRITGSKNALVKLCADQTAVSVPKDRNTLSWSYVRHSGLHRRRSRSRRTDRLANDGCLSWRVFRVNADAVLGCHGHTAETGYVPNRNWYIYVLESRLCHESAALRQASGPYSLT